MHKVFVYGTLKRGYGNNHLLRNSTLLGIGLTTRKFVMRCVGCPVLLEQHTPGAGYILGEIYEVDDTTLVRLDRLEHEGVMYKRKIIKVRQRGRNGGFRKDVAPMDVHAYVAVDPAHWVHSRLVAKSCEGIINWERLY